MYCSQCGKEIQIGSKFCGACGAAQINVERSQNANHLAKMISEIKLREVEIGDNKVRKAGTVATYFLHGILLVGWIVIFCFGLRSSWKTFQYLELLTRCLGMLLYVIPFMFILYISMVGVFGIKREHYRPSIGILISTSAICIKIGATYFTAIVYKSYEIVATQVFHIYGRISIFTLFIGSTIAVLTFIEARKK